jgi:tetratricopeptide (TPR) repeat protein
LERDPKARYQTAGDFTEDLERWNGWIYNYVDGIYRRQGRWREAVASFDRALSLDPRNAEIAKLAANDLALVYALVREPDEAITLIERLLSIPGLGGGSAPCPSEITLAELRLRWEWDLLRGNPRFQKIVRPFRSWCLASYPQRKLSRAKTECR